MKSLDIQFNRLDEAISVMHEVASWGEKYPVGTRFSLLSPFPTQRESSISSEARLWKAPEFCGLRFFANTFILLISPSVGFMI